MKSNKLPEFDDFTNMLDQTEQKLHASQVHGLISGIICGGFPEESAWQELVMGEKLKEETSRDLDIVYQGTRQQLKDFLMQYEIILPDDDNDLPQRAEALTVWCQGFLTGLKVAGVPVIDREDSELSEAINDLIEIAKMNYEEVIATDEDEEAYIELVEYVRMAAIMIYTEINAESDAKKSAESGQLH
jgi:yecA family protein